MPRTIFVAAALTVLLCGCTDRSVQVGQQAAAEAAGAAPVPVIQRGSVSTLEWRARTDVAAEIERLGSEDPWERAQAAARLGELASEPRENVHGDLLSAFPHLLALLSDDTPLLGCIGPLRSAILDTSPGREATLALRALSRHDLDVGPVLDALWTAKTSFHRRNLAEVLGYIADEGALQPLIGLLGDPDADVRTSAAGALAALGSASTIEPLLEAHADGRLDDLTSVNALGQFLASDERARDVVIEVSRAGEDDARKAAVTALNRFGLLAMDSSDPQAEVILSAVLDALRTDPNEEVRAAAAPFTRPHLRRDLDQEMMDALLGALQGDLSPVVREAVLERIAASKRVASGDAVLLALQDGDASVREKALSLAREVLGSTELRAAGLAGLHDPDACARSAAARLLGHASGGPDVREALLEAILSDPDEEVRVMACYSLAGLVRDSRDYRIQTECARALDGLVLDETTPKRLRSAALLVLLTAVEGPPPDGPNPDSIDRRQWWGETRGRYFPE